MLCLKTGDYYSGYEQETLINLSKNDGPIFDTNPTLMCACACKRRESFASVNGRYSG